MDLKDRCHWYQFSLRTVFVGLTLVAAVCSALQLWIAPAERQRIAVRKLQERGGRVVWYEPRDWSFIDIPLLREWLPRDYVDAVASVDFRGTEASEADLQHLHAFARLRGLAPSHQQVTAAGLSRLSGLTELRGLRLDRTPVTDEALAHLPNLAQLSGLYLDDSR